MRTVATAGHVDHGKSSLVLALTGTDPDRFPEEKRRGLTIDLGFAFTQIGPENDPETVGFVDVPGHIRFIKNMLAGVGAVDVAMLVVAANEGWMPQTEEHVRILELLGVDHGIVVVTKADTVDDDTLELAQLEIADRVAGTPLQRWHVVPCDSLSGRGIDDVRRALGAALHAAPGTRDTGRPRLWVDRVFAAKGAGTVVTGTLTLGALQVDDEVVIEPFDRRARVRGIEIHHERRERAEPGSRVAVNLSGIDHHAIGRGDALVRPGQWATPPVIDVQAIALVGDESRGGHLPARGQLAAYIGSGEHRVRWRAFDDAATVGRLHLERPAPLAPGDRIVLRSTGRRVTVGGITVLDVEPPPRRRAALARAEMDPDARLLEQRPWLRADDVAVLAGVTPAEAQLRLDAMVESGVAQRIGTDVTAVATVAALRDQVQRRLRATTVSPSESAGAELATLASSLRVDVTRLRAVLAGDERFTVERELVRAAGSAAPSRSVAAQRFIAALEASPYAPPAPSDVNVDITTARALVREGVVVDLDGVLFAASAVATARRALATEVVARGTVTVSDVRDLLGSSRKFVIPILNQLDREGVTRRRGDERIAGPRAAAASATDDTRDS